MLVAVVTDVPLDGLFNEDREETFHNNNTSPVAERRLKDYKEEENAGLVKAEEKIMCR